MKGPALPAQPPRPTFPYLPSGDRLPQKSPGIHPPRRPHCLGCPPWLPPTPGSGGSTSSLYTAVAALPARGGPRSRRRDSGEAPAAGSANSKAESP